MKLLSILLLACGLSFGAFCSENAPDIKKRAEKLADSIMEKTPKDIKCDWVVLEGIKDNPEILNAAVLKKLKKKYKVYNDRKDIPSKYKIYDSKELVVYRGGFYFSYKLWCDLEGENVELHISYLWSECKTLTGYISLGGGCYCQNIYGWNGKEWIDIFKDSKKVTSSPEKKDSRLKLPY